MVKTSDNTINISADSIDAKFELKAPVYVNTLPISGNQIGDIVIYNNKFYFYSNTGWIQLADNSPIDPSGNHWTVGGNNLTSNGLIGSLNNYDFDIIRNGVTKMSFGTSQTVSNNTFNNNAYAIKTTYNATSSEDVTNKNYVDNALNTKLSLSGGIMSGDIDMSGNKIISSYEVVDNYEVPNKLYVDNGLNQKASVDYVTNNFVSLYGSNMLGDINMATHKITSTYTPVDNPDLTNKLYVDTIDNSKFTINGDSKGQNLAIGTLDNYNLILRCYNSDQVIVKQNQIQFNHDIDAQANKIQTTYAPTLGKDMVNLSYLQNNYNNKTDISNNFVIKSGDTMTGNLTINPSIIINGSGAGSSGGVLYFADNDHYINRPSGTNNIRITSYNDLLLIPTNGNVGIGLTNPATKLQVNGSIQTNTGSFISNNNGAYPQCILDCVSYGKANLQGSGGDLYLNWGGNNTLLNANGSGNVGIGTSNPKTGYKLDVSGEVYINGSIQTNKGSFIATNNGVAPSIYMDCLTYNKANVQSQGGDLFLNWNGNDTLLNANGSGNVSIGFTKSDYKLSINSVLPQLCLYGSDGALNNNAGITFYSTFGSTSDTSSRRAGDMKVGFNNGVWGTEYMSFHVGYDGSANDAQNYTLEKMRITCSGNVGIGITNPNYNLDVSGSINCNNLYLNGVTLKQNLIAYGRILYSGGIYAIDINYKHNGIYSITSPASGIIYVTLDGSPYTTGNYPTIQLTSSPGASGVYNVADDYDETYNRFVVRGYYSTTIVDNHSFYVCVFQ